MTCLLKVERCWDGPKGLLISCLQPLQGTFQNWVDSIQYIPIDAEVDVVPGRPRGFVGDDVGTLIIQHHRVLVGDASCFLAFRLTPLVEESDTLVYLQPPNEINNTASNSLGAQDIPRALAATKDDFRTSRTINSGSNWFRRWRQCLWGCRFIPMPMLYGEFPENMYTCVIPELAFFNRLP